MDNFAQTVISIRLKNNMTQTEFAKHLAVDRVTVARWEAGSRVPSAINMFKLQAMKKNNKKPKK